MSEETPLKRVLFLVLVALASVPSAALAHGDFVGSDPQVGSTVKAVPGQVKVTLTETSARARVTVKDGCGDRVTEDLVIQEEDLIATIGAAQPGDWKVKWFSVSTVDGHSTTGTFSFEVKGAPDCSEPGDEPDPEASPSSTPNDSAGGPSDNGDEGGGFPMLPILFGGGAAIVLAAIVRFAGSR